MLLFLGIYTTMFKRYVADIRYAPAPVPPLQFRPGRPAGVRMSR